jgi:hypothetical protein
MVVVGSLHPNQPGVLQVVVVAVTEGRVVVTVGAGVAVVVVVVGSLHPNQPGVLHVVVVAVLVGEVVAVVVVVVLSSRQPHHPGVSHVDVLVYDVVVEVVVVVVTSEPLLRKNFQRSQSKHSSSATHFGTVSYFKMTSDITFSIL